MAGNRGSNSLGRHNNPVVLDSDDDSIYSNDTLLGEVFAQPDSLSIQIDLTGPEPDLNLRQMPSYKYGAFNLRVGTTIELIDGDFLLISHIAQRRGSQNAFLEGHLFRRTNRLEGLLEKKKNEVVWIQQYNPNVDGDRYRQSLQRVEMCRITAIRDLILTNQIYPGGSYRDDLASLRLTNDEILQTCRLACRWKYLSCGPKEGVLLALDEVETDGSYKVTSSNLKNTFRGASLKGGSCSAWLGGEKNFDHAERVRCNGLDSFGFRQFMDPLQGDGKRYTFGDAFCGAGGVPRGAKAAGLQVRWGFDCDKVAIDSYRLNFHETDCYCCLADTFVTAILDDVKVDILHLSPPCQPHSPAHSRAGQNDEANEASFFALEGILKKVKPRVVLVEETFGLLRNTNRMQYFRAMIQTFTKMGFSVRWKIFNLLDFGLPGHRQRLFLFASCPGEPLPGFPLPSHCSSAEHATRPHMPPFRTINEAISQVPAIYSSHDNPKTRNEAAYNGDVPLPNTICCSTTAGKHPSSRAIHPSGTRAFTSRELACLNGFPLEHEFEKFSKTELRKQIGNAVPPVVAKIFLEQAIKSLRRVDGL